MGRHRVQVTKAHGIDVAGHGVKRKAGEPKGRPMGQERVQRT